MDEPTAHIDQKHDKLINNIMMEHFKGKTVLVIAHKIGSLRHFDKIMVIEDGQIVEYGKPEELELLKEGRYTDMIKKYELL